MTATLTKGERIKARVIRTAANLLQRQGYNGTGLSQILRESATPKGSLYFHFPGGKEELAVAALIAGGTDISNRLQAAITVDTDPGHAIEFACTALAEELSSSNYEKGCPLATVALEAASSSEPIREVCASYFQGWQDIVYQMLLSRNVEPIQAGELATLAIASLEGAILLCRANHNTEPLERVGRQLRILLETTLAQT
jgi:TetR/AcrR family transcriptional repressor of lmrAB and yxaGH operons